MALDVSGKFSMNLLVFIQVKSAVKGQFTFTTLVILDSLTEVVVYVLLEVLVSDKSFLTRVTLDHFPKSKWDMSSLMSVCFV